MSVLKTSTMLKIADKLEGRANKIRLSVAKSQRKSRTAQTQEIYNFLDEVNKRRQEAGLPPIVPLLTDKF